MSAAPGTEALDDGLFDAEPAAAPVAPARQLDPHHLVISHRTQLPPRPATGSVRVPQLPQLPQLPNLRQLPRSASSPRDWASALRLRSLPTSLIGATVALLLALAEPAVSTGTAVVAVAGLVVLHLVAALLRALGDKRSGSAGPLRRVEAGRVLLALVVVGAGLAITLTVLRGSVALLLAAAGIALAVGWLRPSAVVSDVAVAAGAAASCAAVWWAAVGTLPWQVLLAALVAWLVVAALRSESTSRALLAAPCAAVGLAVALHALPWPALVVALSLPVARRAAGSGRPAAAPARLALVLLLAGLGAAFGTGTDLPLTAAG